MNSLIEQKARVTRLRDLYEKETDPMIKESIRFRLANARLGHNVAECGVLEAVVANLSTWSSPDIQEK